PRGRGAVAGDGTAADLIAGDPLSSATVTGDQLGRKAVAGNIARQGGQASSPAELRHSPLSGPASPKQSFQDAPGTHRAGKADPCPTLISAADQVEDLAGDEVGRCAVAGEQLGPAAIAGE